VVVKEDPLNCEVRLGRLAEGAVTPNERFYIRSHFPVPAINPGEWRLQVRGLVRNPLGLALDDLRKLPAREDAVTLECAGNGRSFFRPKIEGEPWALGAVSTAVWKGVALRSVLDAAGL
jgi:DMSO/TMAO reductase YedYZ molybdopterin-dependent catalytic subunit